MKKIINPCKCKVFTSNNERVFRNAFAEINFKEGKLSIHGVVAPLSNGNCLGGAGQCISSFEDVNNQLNDGWTREMLNKFCQIWHEWHLNDMRPYCEHQKELGWDKKAKEKIILYHYKLTKEAEKKRKAAFTASKEALCDGKIFLPTAEQAFYANLKCFYDTYNELRVGHELFKYYEPYKSCIGTPATEVKTRGWVRYDESKKGILSKPCPVCGYKYGSGWKTEEVPQDVIDWLFNLPEAKIRPAWI